MIGAILGDMIGSVYEFAGCGKRTDFPLLSGGSGFTDDTVMTVAVASALLNVTPGMDDDAIRAEMVWQMRFWGNNYPDAGYGGMFRGWLNANDPRPYYSFGNGSAMRVSSVGWLYETLQETRRMARLSAEVTHDHPEGIKGAEAVASSIWLARTGHSKEEIHDFIVEEFWYDLDRTCDEIRPGYRFDVTCQGSVPEAIIAFLDATDYEQTVRLAVSLGGDADTQAAIAGSIAEAFWGVPEELRQEALARLPQDMREILERFGEKRLPRMARED